MIAFCLVGALLGASFQDPAGVGQSAQLLDQTERRSHFIIRYQVGSKAGSQVDRIAHLAELEYAEIVETLTLDRQLKQQEPFFLFLYEDLNKLSEITGVGGTGGFSTARESHLPYDNDQTRKHEMVHILMAAARPGPEDARNMFFVEGIANAVLQFVHGVPVHAVAAYEKRRNSLPALAELRQGDFYQYLADHPGFNGYDVGGSFMRFLLSTYGPKKTVDFYFGEPIERSLGQSWAKVEERWKMLLDGFKIRPELLRELALRRGDPDPSLQELRQEMLGDPAEWSSFLDDLDIAATQVSKLHPALQGSSPHGSLGSATEGWRGQSGDATRQGQHDRPQQRSSHRLLRSQFVHPGAGDRPSVQGRRRPCAAMVGWAPGSGCKYQGRCWSDRYRRSPWQG